jgi:hypothetical protein
LYLLAAELSHRFYHVNNRVPNHLLSPPGFRHFGIRKAFLAPAAMADKCGQTRCFVANGFRAPIASGHRYRFRRRRAHNRIFLHRSSMQTIHYPESLPLALSVRPFSFASSFCASPLGRANFGNIDCSHHNYELDTLTSSGYFLNGWQSALTWQTYLPNRIATAMGGSAWNDRSLG